MMELAFPARTVWLTPGGGGMEPGETEHETLQRELYEEIGRRDLLIGPEIWRRVHGFKIEGEMLVQHERYYLIQVGQFTASNENMPDEPERGWFQRFAWWSVEAIASSPAVFAPKGLDTLLTALLRNGPPATPTDISSQRPLNYTTHHVSRS